MRSFKILYALLTMIFFNEGMLRKWYLRLLKSSMRFYPFYSNLDESGRKFWTNLCSIEMIFFNDGRLKKLNVRLFYFSLHFTYSILFGFERIWTKTFRPYSCSIKMIFFNDEKLKKWNLRLLKSSMRIFKNLYVLLEIIFFNDWMFKIQYALL